MRSVKKVATKIVPVFRNVTIRQYMSLGRNDDPAPTRPLLRQTTIAWAEANGLDPHNRWKHARKHRILRRSGSQHFRFFLRSLCRNGRTRCEESRKTEPTTQNAG